MNYTTQSIRHIYNETQRLKQDNFPFQIKSPRIFWHRVTADDYQCTFKSAVGFWSFLSVSIGQSHSIKWDMALELAVE